MVKRPHPHTRAASKTPSVLATPWTLSGIACFIVILAFSTECKQIATTKYANEGCLRRLATGDKDLPPIHICSSGKQLGSLETQSLDNEQPVTSWIVIWQDIASKSSIQAACAEAELSSQGRYNGTCTATFGSIFTGFSAKFTQSQLLLFLSAHPEQVVSVHEDGGVTAAAVQLNASWALDRVDQEFLPLNSNFTYYNTGSNVNVYIVDTGIRVSHDEFRHADGTSGSRAREVFTSLESGTAGQDCNGHGTAVAATVGGLTYGPAKNATLLAVRSLECLGNGTVSQVIQGLEWVKDNFVPPAVVVMALGGNSQYALDLAVAEVVQAGVAVFVAAGNDDTDACLKSPAREPLAITVSATDSNDSRLWVGAGTGADYGSCVDIWAPGTDILSADSPADNATKYRSGTSQAVPFVAGAIALYLQNNSDASPQEVSTALMSAGSWGLVHEPTASGPLNANALAGTNNVLLNADMFHALDLQPERLQITGGTDGFGPFIVNVTLAQAPEHSVSVAIAVSAPNRATVAPQEMSFSASNWHEPQQLNVTTALDAYQTVNTSDFYIQLNLTSDDARFNDTHPRLQVSDAKGDKVEYPMAILSLPFSHQGNTYFFKDDYNLECNTESQNTTGGSKDVVYFFQPQEDCLVTISTCNSAQFVEDFDTILYVLGNATGPASMGIVSCNDDACSYLSQLQVNMTAGTAYAIVLDGYGGKFGQYQIDITAKQGELGGTVPPPNLGELVTVPSKYLTSQGVISPQPSPATADGQTPARDSSPSDAASSSPGTISVPELPTSSPSSSPTSPAFTADESQAYGSDSTGASNRTSSPAPLSPAGNNSTSNITAAPVETPGSLGLLAQLSPGSPTAGSVVAPSLIPHSTVTSALPNSTITAVTSNSANAASVSNTTSARTNTSDSASPSPDMVSTLPLVSSASAPLSSPPRDAALSSSRPTPLSTSPDVHAPPPASSPSLAPSSALPPPVSSASLTDQKLPSSPSLTPLSLSSTPLATSNNMYTWPQHNPSTLALDRSGVTQPTASVPLSSLSDSLATAPERASAPRAAEGPESAYGPASGPYSAPGPAPASAPATPALAPASAAAAAPAPTAATVVNSPRRLNSVVAATSSSEPASSGMSASKAATSVTTSATAHVPPARAIAGPPSAADDTSNRSGVFAGRADASESQNSHGAGSSTHTVATVAGCVAAAAGVILGVSMFVLVSHRKRRYRSTQAPPKTQQMVTDLSATASDDSQAPQAIVAQSRQPSGVEPVGLPHLHLTPTHALSSAHSTLHSHAYSYADSIPACGSVSGIHTGASVCTVPMLHTQTVVHPDAEESALTVALKDLQLAEAQQQQQQHQECTVQHGSHQAMTAAQSQAVFSQHAGPSQPEQSVVSLQSQPILQGQPKDAGVVTVNEPAQAADIHQHATVHVCGQKPAQPRHIKQGGFAVDRAQQRQHGTQAPATCVVGVKANGVHSLTEAQLKCLSSLEVARQRQSNRSKLRFGATPQAAQRVQHANSAAASLQHSSCLPGALQQLPREVPEQLPQRLPLMEMQQSVAVNQMQAAPSAQQQARQKLNAIRDELGNLEKARKAMLDQQQSTLTIQRQASQQKLSSKQRGTHHLPLGNISSMQAWCNTVQQPTGRKRGTAQIGTSFPPAGSAPNTDDAAAVCAVKSMPKGGVRASTTSGITTAASSGGMSWNPLRLMNPFDSSGAQGQTAGQVHTQAASRSGWSLHSITFSAADVKAVEAKQQLTLSQMTWSLEKRSTAK